MVFDDIFSEQEMLKEQKDLEKKVQDLEVRSLNTVKPFLRGQSKTGKTNVLKTDGSLMQVKSIAECSPWSILQYF